MVSDAPRDAPQPAEVFGEEGERHGDVVRPDVEMLSVKLTSFSLSDALKAFTCVIATCHPDLVSREPRQSAFSFSQPERQDGVVVFGVMEGEAVSGGGGGAAAQLDGNSEPHCDLPLSFPLGQRICVGTDVTHSAAACIFMDSNRQEISQRWKRR